MKTIIFGVCWAVGCACAWDLPAANYIGVLFAMGAIHVAGALES